MTNDQSEFFPNIEDDRNDNENSAGSQASDSSSDSTESSKIYESGWSEDDEDNNGLM